MSSRRISGRRIGRRALACAVLTLGAWTAGAPPAGAQTAPGTSLVALAARPGQQMTGMATLTAQGDRTLVAVRVTGGPASSTHVNHIHTGSCENEGAIVYPLTDLRTDASGTATATTVVDAPLASLLGGNNYVNVHAGFSLPSPGIACGNILGALALPATGTGPQVEPEDGS